MNIVVPGIALPIEMTAYDDDSGLFPALLVYETTTGSEVFLGKINMHSVAGGTYLAYFTPGTNKSYLIRKAWYTDGTYLVLDASRAPGSESFYSFDVPSAVWAALRSGNNVSGSFGEAHQGVFSTARASNLDFLDVSVASREAESAAATRATTAHSDELVTQGAIATLSTKVGTPAGASVIADIAAVKSVVDATSSAVAVVDGNVDAIKLKTDRLNFDGSDRVTAHTMVNEDKNGYELDATSRAAVADAVWDEALSGHAISGSTGAALTAGSSGASPTVIAGAVWDVLVASHATPNTFGDYVQVIRQFAADLVDDVTSGVYGLAAAKANVDGKAATILDGISDTQDLINTLPAVVDAARDSVNDNVNDNETRLIQIQSQASANQAALLSQHATTQGLVSTVDGHVLTLQNNTTARFIVPEPMVIPASVPKNYRFELRLCDAEGNPTTPDSTPTITVTRLDSGVLVVSNAAMTQHGTDPGSYYYQFVLGPGSASYPAMVEARVVEAGMTRRIPASTEVTPFDNDLSEVITQLAAVQSKVDDIDALATNGTIGFAAIKAAELTTQAAVAAAQASVGLVKAKTDNLPAAPAAVADVQAVTTAVMTRPDLAQIVAQLNIIKVAIMGPDLRNITQVYDAIDFTDLVQANDPRLDYLDRPISTRSTLSALQVWTYVNRELTDFTLPAADVKKVWDYLASAAVPLSMGARIKDYLNAPVNALPTLAQITSQLVGVAQEATVSGLSPLITNGHVTTQNLITALTLIANAVKAKTDHLPSDPASAGTVGSAVGGVSTQVSNMAAQVAQVLAKTNFLPADPARQSTLLTVPTNPLRDDDTRINRLDVAVSSRSTFDGNLSSLATHSDVTNSTLALLDATATVLSAVNTVGMVTGQVKLKTDNLPSHPVSLTELNAATASVLTAIDDIPESAGITAAEVWDYTSRTLTDAPPPPDLSALATHEDVAAINQYQNEMSTTFKTSTGEQQILVWATKNGRRITGSNCAITVRDGDGVMVYVANLPTPNADGVFQFKTPVSLTPSQDYYVVIDITVDAVSRVNHKSFSTVA